MSGDTTATNIKLNADREIDNTFLDSPGSELDPIIVVTGSNLSTPLTGSYKTAAYLRIGNEAARRKELTKITEDADTGGIKFGPVTLLGDDQTILAFDSNRQGKNVIDTVHFSRMNLPLISINREGFTTRKNHLKHTAAFNIYGITKLFRSYDEKTKTAIPFEDFPGRLDPVAYIAAGDYILQYMIINDLTKDIDKFTNPDDLNGVVEVFEIRESFANTSISDIPIKGMKGSLPTQMFYATNEGASSIENKFEIKQIANSFFLDSQDIFYGESLFGPKEGYTHRGPWSFDAVIPEERRIMTPYDESSGDAKIKFQSRVRNFLKSGSFTGAIASETQVPDLGTRYRSGNSGFINHPNYVIIGKDHFINAGTDSIAFAGMSKN